MQATAPELEILKILWRSAPLTARQIHQGIEDKLDWSFSSTRKTLERMEDKGLVILSTAHKKKTYFAKADKVQTLAAFARDFTRRIFEIDGPLPVAMFSGSKVMEDEEIQQLEALLHDKDTKA